MTFASPITECNSNVTRDLNDVFFFCRCGMGNATRAKLLRLSEKEKINTPHESNDKSRPRYRLRLAQSAKSDTKTLPIQDKWAVVCGWEVSTKTVRTTITENLWWGRGWGVETNTKSKSTKTMQAARVWVKYIAWTKVLAKTSLKRQKQQQEQKAHFWMA